MRRLPHLADFRTKVLDGSGSWRIQQMKRRGKTKITMLIRRMFVGIGRRNGTAVRRMLANLGKTVADSPICKRSDTQRQQKRLQNQRINSRRADQRLPELPPLQPNVGQLDSHLQEIMLIPCSIPQNCLKL